MKKNIKKIIFKIIIFLFKVSIIYILINTLSEGIIVSNDKNGTFINYIEMAFKRIYILDSQGRNIINFMKILITISIYLIIEFNLIFYTSNVSSGFKDIIKYYSVNKKTFYKNIIKISARELMVANIYWSVIFIIIVKTLKIKIEQTEIIYYLTFIIINNLVNIFIILISLNEVMSILCYILKPFAYTLFIHNEIYLVCLMLIYIFFSININNLGEKYENRNKKWRKKFWKKYNF